MFGMKPKTQEPPKEEAPVKEKRRPKIGLALGSGIARGWAHIGLMRVFDKYNIRPDVIAGTSIGAVVGGMYLAGKLDELEAWARSLKRVKLMKYLDFTVRTGGLITGKNLDQELANTLGDVLIEDLPTPFACIATDLLTGHEIWLKEGPLKDRLRASFSLPGIFAPVLLNEQWLVDGALVNPIPVSTCYAMGAEIVIAVNLSGDMIGKSRKPGKNYQTIAGFDVIDFLESDQSSPGTGILTRFAKNLFSRDYDGPSMMGAMVASLGIIQDRISRSRIAGDPPDVHIVPKVGHIGIMEFERCDELIALGETAAIKALPDIKDALSIYGADIDI